MAKKWLAEDVVELCMFLNFLSFVFINQKFESNLSSLEINPVYYVQNLHYQISLEL